MSATNLEHASGVLRARLVPRSTLIGLRKPLVAMSVMVMLAACGGGKQAATPKASAMVHESSSSNVTTAENACPVDGCKISFVNVEKAGDELKVTFMANYTPDISKNHFHVFWDNFTPKQVSDNAERVWGVKQGSWEPTADNPYTTAGAASVKQRGRSTKLCVTPGDRDHNVIDPSVVECTDVGSFL
jgi:hypothetical protein